MLRRREFLGCGAAGAGLSFVSLAGGMPGLLARAAEESAKAGRNDRALVVIELAGGNDGLNTVVPFENALYYRNRRTLGIPKKDVVRLNDQVGLHPKMEALGELFREGQVAVVQGVGYPEPDRSHFRSMEIWHTASTEAKAPAAGWLGRYLDSTRPAPAPAPAPADDFPRGLALTDALPQALQAEAVSVPVVAQLDDFAEDASLPAKARRKLSTGPAPSAGKPASPVAFLRRQAETLYRTADRLKQAMKDDDENAAGYPDDGLGPQLRRAARILGSGLGVRILFASQDGYDTHSGQAEAHGNLLGALSDSLAAFQKDLAARKLADRVLVLVFSEFGRRVDENASQGTDHGAASNVFLVGGKVKGGLAGRYPSLETLGDGDLIFNTDFRSVYATVLGRWLGCPPEPLLGQAFPELDLIG